MTAIPSLPEVKTDAAPEGRFPAWLGPILLACGYAAAMLVFWLLLAHFVMMMLDHAYTPDLPWLLESGCHLLKSHQLPTHDIFSWSYPDKPWVLYQWLFEVLTAGSWQQWGMQGTIRLFTVLMLGLYVFLPAAWLRRKGVPLAFIMLICGLNMLILPVNLSLRPMAATSFLVAAQFFLIQGFRRGSVSAKVLFPAMAGIYLLWSNLHTGVTIGLISLGIMAAGDFIERRGWYRFTPAVADIEGKPQRLRLYLGLAALGFLASLANPYGIGIYHYLAELSGQQYLNDNIIELRSPNFHTGSFQMFMLLMLGLVLVMQKCQRALSAQDILHLAVFTLATLFVQRFVVWASLFYILIFSKALFHVWQDRTLRLAGLARFIKGLDALQPVILGGAALGLLWFLVAPPEGFPKARYGICSQYLKGLEAYGKIRQPGDRLFNDSVLGSCLLIRYPQDKVFIDTRFDFYGEDHLARQHVALELLGDWRGYLNRWDPTLVMIKSDYALGRLLTTQPGFKELYRDKKVVIFRRQPNRVR